MATFAFSNNRLTGHQGRFTSPSLSSAGVLSATGVASGDDSIGDSDTNFWLNKRVIALYDSNTILKGHGYVGARTDSSDTAHTFQMDVITNASGGTSYFVDVNGNNVDVTSTDVVYLSGCLSDPSSIVASSNPAVKQSFNIAIDQSGDDNTTTSSPKKIQLGQNNRVLWFGTTTAGDEDGVVFHDENILFYNESDFKTQADGASVGFAQYGALGWAMGFISFGRIIDYAEGDTTGGCTYMTNVQEDSGSGSNGTNEYENVAFSWDDGNHSTPGTNIRWFGGTIYALGARTWFPHSVKSPGSNDRYNAATQLWYGITTNSPIVYNVQNSEVMSAITVDGVARGGVDNCVIERMSAYIISDFLPFRWLGTIRNSSVTTELVDSGNGGAAALTGTLTSTFSTASSPGVVGAYGVGYVGLPAGKPAADDQEDYYCFLRSSGGDSNRTQYWEMQNVLSGTRTFRDSTAGNFNSNGRMRWRYGGNWFDLNEGSVVYGSHLGSMTDGGLNGSGNFSGSFDDWKKTVPASGELLVDFTDAVYRAADNSPTISEDDNGFFEYTNSDEAQQCDEVRYGIYDWGKNDIVVHVTRSTQNVGNITPSVWNVAPNNTNSLGGGRTGGVIQQDDENITNGRAVDGTTALTETAIATLVGTWNASDVYPNATQVNGAAAASITYDDAGIGSESVINLDQLYAMNAYNTSNPGDDDEGYRHLRNPVDTVDSNNLWDLTDINNDGVATDVTSFQMLFASGFGDRVASAEGSTIVGIKTDQNIDLTKFDLNHGIVIEHTSGQSSVGFSDFPINNEDNPIGACTIEGRWDHTSNDDIEIWFDDEDNLDIASNFQVRNNGTGTITVFGLSTAANTTLGATAPFNNTSTGDIVFRAVTTLTIQHSDSTEDLVAADLVVEAYDSDNNLIDDADITTTASDNVLTVQILHPAGTTISYACHYWDDTDASPTSYEIITAQTVSGAQPASTLVAIAGLTSKDFGDLGGASDFVRVGETKMTADDSASVPTAISSTTANIVINLWHNDADGCNLSDAQTRTWIHNNVCRTEDFLRAVARGFVPFDLFTYRTDNIEIDGTEETRIEFYAPNTSFNYYYLNSQVIDTDGDDLFRLLTGTDARHNVIFSPVTSGISFGQFQDQMNQRGVTRQNLTNLGLIVPILNEDMDAFETSPNTP